MMVVGSTAEVALAARVFNVDAGFQTDFNTEVDVMWVFASLDSAAAVRDTVVRVGGKPGFVKLKGNAFVHNCLGEARFQRLTRDTTVDGFLLRSKTLISSDGFVDGTVVIKIARKYLTFGNRLNLPDLEFFQLVAAAAVHANSKDVKIRSLLTKEGPSCCLAVELQLRNGMCYKMSGDNVPCVRTPWPQEAQEWTFRRRRWPSKHHVQEISSSHCHLVPKSAPVSTGGDPVDTEWRWSFSWAEIQLVALYTDTQKVAYLIFKSIFYRHLKKVQWEKRYLTSYAIKTTMLRECENTDENDWESNKLVLRVASLCVRLREYLEDCNLPHYFIPNINILEGYEKGHLLLLVEALNPISVDDPLSVSPFGDMVTENVTSGIEQLLADVCSSELFSLLKSGMHTTNNTFLDRSL